MATGLDEVEIVTEQFSGLKIDRIPSLGKLADHDVSIHVVNVGQGDSILVEQKTTKKWYLVDGGNFEDKNPHNNLEKTLQEKKLIENNILKLDAIIITHPDGDHIGGINRLLTKFIINCPIITTEATQVIAKREPMEIPSETLNDDLSGVELKFPKKGPKIFRDIKKIESCDEKKNFNETSILFAAGKIQLTGDSKGELIHKATGLGKIEDLTKDVKVFQVPHHGSGENSYVPYEVSKKLSPGDPLYELQHNSKHPAYREALFYRGIQAKTYFISFGYENKHKHPHSNVITGIIISAVTQRKKCTIVTTANFSHDRVNYPDPEEYEKFPQGWKQYVDIVVPEKEDTPYITITGDGAVSHTKPWEPDKPSMKTRSSDKTGATV